jgi:hypothetical protein
MRPEATGSPFTSRVTSPPVAGLGASAANTISTLTSPVGRGVSASCVYSKHAQHRVVVRQLPVLDVEAEASEVVERGTITPSAPPSGTTRSALIVYEWL